MKNEALSEIGFINTVNDHIDLCLTVELKMLVMYFFFYGMAKLKVSK
jgi:hypothetical protein